MANELSNLMNRKIDEIGHLIIALPPSQETNLLAETWKEFLELRRDYLTQLKVMAEAAKRGLGFLDTGDEQ